MAVVEEGSDGSRSPSPPKKYTPLSKWSKDDRRDEVPRAPVGANYRPVVPTARPSYDSSRLKDLTPFAVPRPEPVSPAPAGDVAPFMTGQSPADAPLSSTTGAYYAAAKAAAGGGAPASEPEPKTLEPKETTKRVLKLTWDEYEKLNDAKRAAVDFNTLLVQAREKDLNTDYNPTPAQKEHFQAEAERVFGEGHGSETFAPETLGVLKDLDFKSSGTEDLDNFLGLKDAISAKELKGFSFDREVRPPEVENAQRDSVLKAISPGGAGGLATEQRAGVYTQNLQSAMVNANELLQTWRASATQHRYGDVLGLGGDPTTPGKARPYRMKPPYEDADADGNPDKYPFQSLAQDTLAALSNPKMPLETPLAAIGTLDEKDTQEIMRYFDEQTRASIQTGSGVLGIDGKNTRNPVEIRKLLGLDGVN